VSAIDDAAQNPCGTNKITTTTFAKSDKECGEQPHVQGVRGAARCTV
jgi:hypothetical protein